MKVIGHILAVGQTFFVCQGSQEGRAMEGEDGVSVSPWRSMKRLPLRLPSKPVEPIALSFGGKVGKDAAADPRPKRVT